LELLGSGLWIFGVMGDEIIEMRPSIDPRLRVLVRGVSVGLGGATSEVFFDEAFWLGVAVGLSSLLSEDMEGMTSTT
jgi:hypothetical protein